MWPLSRSPTNALPSGRTARPHGVVRPVATVSAAVRSGTPGAAGAAGDAGPDAAGGAAVVRAGAGPVPPVQAATSAAPATARASGSGRRLGREPVREGRMAELMVPPCHDAAARACRFALS